MEMLYNKSGKGNKMKKNNTASSNKVTYLTTSDKVCPVCGSTHIQGITRITGYMSLDERFGEGKVNERKARRDHNAGHKNHYVHSNSESNN
jgi:ribonucleoside-triphosphate reductase